MRKTRSDKLPDDIRIANRKKAYAKYRSKYPDRIAKAQKKYREKNRQKIKEAGVVLRKRMRAVRDKAKSVPCQDCGGIFPPCCMDFDHREGEEKHRRLTHKENGYKKMPTAVGSLSTKAFLLEIKKCDVVCANCHRIRTEKRRDKS